MEKNSPISLIKQYLFPWDKKAYIGLITSAIHSLSFIPTAYLLQQLLQDIQAGGNIESLTQNGFLLITIFLIQASLAVYSRRQSIYFTNRQVALLREKSILALLGSSSSFFDTYTPAMVQKILLMDTEATNRLFNTILTKIMPAFIISITIICLLVIFNRLLTFLFIITLPILFLALQPIKKKKNKHLSQYHEGLLQWGEQSDFVAQQHVSIKMSGTSEITFRSITSHLASLRQLGVNMVMGFTYTSQIQEALQSVIVTVILLIGGIQVIKGDLLLEELLTFYFMLFILRKYFTQLITQSIDISEGLSALRRVDDFIISALNHQEKSGDIRLSSIENIVFDEVSFTYGNQEVLQHVNFSIKPNKINLFTGENGSGKTTIIKLITYLIQQNQGGILINDTPIHFLDIDHYRQKIGVVFQDQSLFKGTIYDNLTFNKEIKESSIKKALQIVNAEEWITELPNGLYTEIGAINNSISGGQKQRLMIARALLNNPSLLILDEPTNHLDQETIGCLLSFLKSQCKDMTIIIISHDPAVIPLADHCFLFSNKTLQEHEPFTETIF
ncbi:ABC transporter ATP-binding protein [Algivirga pacifica]|uniref:ABC transporter ATP-binding protein n=1 Tax=Algivirga pacifica TaxID=1162670 RepID=A0ABP9DET9_9BACT